MESASRSTHRLLLLGPLQIIQNGTQRPLPPSRKVRALLAYLAMTAACHSRKALCAILGCRRRPEKRVALVPF
jgi:DNA-binding SARP family transcriptional activator